MMLALAWTRLYGFPKRPQLWFCFFYHDFGYVGKPNMDGEEGETHPVLGSTLIELLFGKDWGEFCRYHSRFYSRLEGKPISQLCVADKLAFNYYPIRLYIWLARATGEMDLYKNHSEDCDSWADMDDVAWCKKLRQFNLRLTVRCDGTYFPYVKLPGRSK